MTARKRKAAAILILLDVVEDEDELGDYSKRGKTRSWMRKRREKGYFNNIFAELSAEDTDSFKEMIRMSKEEYNFILAKIEKDITPKQIVGGNKICTAKEKLSLTLRFLATGETYRSLCWQFRISRAAISYIIIQVCKAIKTQLAEYMTVPTTTREWLAISRKFGERWNYPNCIGAVDGKHIVMQPPPSAGSKFYNYKHTHSIVLMPVAGPDYECIYADIGTNGRVSDGGVWNKCSLSNKIDTGELSLPVPSHLPLSEKVFPYVLLGDDAFALKPHMMKPYPQTGITEDKRIYNYRHSRARRISENLFGIIANRWRVFRSVILLPPETIEHLVLAALTLHNFLRKSSSRNLYCPPGLADMVDNSGNLFYGRWRASPTTESMLPLQTPSSGHNASNTAKSIRENFKEYFCKEGAVSWQWGIL